MIQYPIISQFNDLFFLPRSDLNADRKVVGAWIELPKLVIDFSTLIDHLIVVSNVKGHQPLQNPQFPKKSKCNSATSTTESGLPVSKSPPFTSSTLASGFWPKSQLSSFSSLPIY
jgi:hypothetical protein